MRPGDPNDDAGNRALDYATDNVEKKLAGMDLEELCEEFGIGLAEGIEGFDAHYERGGFDTFIARFLHDVHIGETEPVPTPQELFNEMLCESIRANEAYQQQMSEKLQEQHRAGEVDDWAGQDDAEEKAGQIEGVNDDE